MIKGTLKRSIYKDHRSVRPDHLLSQGICFKVVKETHFTRDWNNWGLERFGKNNFKSRQDTN
jgi:hypothetical protein